MGKIIIYILIAYIIYYAVNVLYDLFFQKEKINKNGDDGVEISLGEISSEENKTKNIQVDDVEKVILPNSYELEDSNYEFQETENSEVLLDELRNNFEEEELLNNDELTALDMASNSLKEILDIDSKDANIQQKESLTKKELLSDEKWNDFMKKATSHVVLKNNVDGHKSFVSTLSI